MRARLAVFLCVTVIASGAAAAQDLPRAAVDKVKTATVFVVSARGTGTAFVFNRSGSTAYLLTCEHVVAGDTKVKVVFNSGQKDEVIADADVVGTDPRSDIASLRVKTAPKDSQALTLGKKTALRETEAVFAAGFPFGGRLAADAKNPEIAISRASVSSIRRDNASNVVAIQLGGEVHPGNSGGPIVDVAGKVVGIAQSKIMGTGTAFAVPPEQIEAFLRGGVRAMTVGHEAVSLTETKVSVQLSLVNPQDAVKAAGVLWLPASKVPAAPAQPGARLAPTMGEVALKIDGGQATGSFSVKRAAGEPEFLDLVLQPYFKASDGALVHLAPSTARISFEAPAPPGPVVAAGVPGEIAKPVVPKKSVPPVEATTEREDDGRSFTRVKAAAKKINLGKTLLQISATPSGSSVCAIYREEGVVKVFDPETWEVTKEIVTPRSPTSLWCDDKRIVVTCTESKVVTFLDPVAGKPVKSVPMNDPEGPADLAPVAVIGRAPDGSYMTLWQATGTARWDIWLYHVSETGRPRRIMKSEIQYACYVRGGKALLAQRNFRGSPSGVPSLVEVGTGKDQNLYSNTLFGPTAGWHRNFGHIFLTQDRRHVILPTTKIDNNYGYQSQTYLADPELKKFVLDVPGTVFAESASEGTLVSWGIGYKDKKELGPEIYYSSRSNGRVIRKVSIKDYNPHPAEPTYVNPWQDVFFLPGHELVVIKPKNDSAGDVYVVRCGPVAAQAAVGADPGVVVKNDPPAKATVGKEVVFSPDFEKPANVKSIVFKLKKGPDEIKVDPATGRMTWKPTDAYAGKFDLSIVAVVDGAEVPVVAWTIEVGF
jgi:S1-C subfamily serine protease